MKLNEIMLNLVIFKCKSKQIVVLVNMFLCNEYFSP